MAVVPAEQVQSRGDLPQVGSAGLAQRILLRDSHCCFLRGDHPALVDGALTLEAYAGLAHALVSPGGKGPGLVDRVLAERGLRRRVALRVPHFHAAPTCVEGSDLVLTAPTSLKHLLPAGSSLIAVEAPLPLPRHAIALVWHQRFSQEPGHLWLRGLLTEVSRELLPQA